MCSDGKDDPVSLHFLKPVNFLDKRLRYTVDSLPCLRKRTYSALNARMWPVMHHFILFVYNCDSGSMLEGIVTKGYGRRINLTSKIEKERLVLDV